MSILASQRHERFSQLIASGEAGAAAYRTTYGVRGANAESCASRLSRNVKVRERVQELQSKAEKRTLLTMQRRRELLQQRAEDPKTKNAELVALLALDAKLAGELTDRQDVTTDGRRLSGLRPIVINAPESFYYDRGT